MKMLVLQVTLLGLVVAAPVQIEIHPSASCPTTSGSSSGGGRRGGSAHVFCSLHTAAAWIALQRGRAGATSAMHAGSTIHACLHPGVHTLRQPLRFNDSHSGTRWKTCAAAAAGARCAPGTRTHHTSPHVRRRCRVPTRGAGSRRAIISGGLRVPAASWKREGRPGLWAASLRAAAGGGGGVQHLRTLWIGGVRANRTVLNASALLGDLACTASGYVTQREVPWQAAAEAVELNYFQQLAPWQAQRCVLTRASGHRLTVAQPCFASISQRA
eukprot:SAG11_NODE_8260_length_1038_cov_1.149095_1_plen_270_part_01